MRRRCRRRNMIGVGYWVDVSDVTNASYLSGEIWCDAIYSISAFCISDAIYSISAFCISDAIYILSASCIEADESN